MQPRLVVFQHVAMEGPARLLQAAARAGLCVEVVRLDESNLVPEVMAGDVLVVMGGPMGIADLGDARYPFLAAEVDLLQARLAADAPTLGICLGAQLLAHAAGAQVYPNRRPRGRHSAGEPISQTAYLEVGWGPVQFLNRDQEPALKGMREEELMLHWHGDTFDLPEGAVLLASSADCQHQGFRIGKRLYGLQFHCEADAQSVQRWVKEDAAFVKRALGETGCEQILAQTRVQQSEHQQARDRLLDNILLCMLDRN